MFAVDSPWAEILLLAARVIGFGAILAACCRGIVSLFALAALLVTMEIAFLPVVTGLEIDLGMLLTSAPAPGSGSPLMLLLALQLAVGLMLGIPAAGVALSASLFAHWANAIVEPRFSDEPGRQRALEQALLLLCVLSMAPYFSNLFRFFAEGFLGFPFRAIDLGLPAVLWQLAAAAGKMAFASALLLLLPSLVLLLGFSLCLLLFQRLFPALLSDSTTRALLIPCLLLTLALGMYRSSIAWTDGFEQSLRVGEMKKLEQLEQTVSNE